MKAIIFAIYLMVCLASCSNNGNAGHTSDTSVNGSTDTSKSGINGNGSGMTGPTTGTMQSGDTTMKQRINDTFHKNSVR